MLIPNNPLLNVDQITQRLQNIMKRKQLTAANIQITSSRSPERPQRPSKRSALASVLTWFKCLRRLRRIRDAAELGRAASAKIGPLEGQLSQVAQEFTDLSINMSDLSDDVKAIGNVNKRIEIQLSELRREILFQQRRLTRMTVGEAPIKPIPSEVAQSHLDACYLAFEDRFRGERPDIKSRLVPYVERVKIAGAGQRDYPILDLGCGRGEWLEVLKESGLCAYGVDGNTMMIERAANFGLDARCEDLMQHLSHLEPASRSAVTAFHVVEHIPFPTLIALLDEALRVLIPGGLLIIETPNPETMRVGATTFYNDPTHWHPLPPTVMQFMVEQRGFSDLEIIKLHPFSQGLLQGGTADAELLNRVLFGPQDYAVIARRGQDDKERGVEQCA